MTNPIRPLDAFRTAVAADRSLLLELMGEYRPEAFIALACRRATERGIVLPPDALAAVLEPVERHKIAMSANAAEAWPDKSWLPVGLFTDASGAVVDWHCFAGIALDTPFFFEAAMQAGGLPFNRVMARRMGLDAMLRAAPAASRPAGLIFHLSRCGSTLVHRMLSASGLTTSLSEAPAFDTALRLCLNWNGPRDVKVSVLRAIAAGLANNESGLPLTLKCDAWHILAWPLLHEAFPDTPAIFLYRDPVQVMVSQKRLRGIQAVPQSDIAALCGIADYAAMGLDEYYARYFAACCKTAGDAVRQGAMIAIDYDTLPESVATRILPHFGWSPDKADIAGMQSVAQCNAKMPDTPFVADSREKDSAADAAIREWATLIAEPAYRELKTLTE